MVPPPIGKKFVTRAGLMSSAEKKAIDASPNIHELVGMKVITDISAPKSSPSGKNRPGRPAKTDSKKRLDLSK